MLMEINPSEFRSKNYEMKHTYFFGQILVLRMKTATCVCAWLIIVFYIIVFACSYQTAWWVPNCNYPLHINKADLSFYKHFVSVILEAACLSDPAPISTYMLKNVSHTCLDFNLMIVS